ncbi:helix-turn-helix transcriptional regulator [Paenarthrobacter nicotinovorans]|uniref:helix-turn-helix transcriptional regulator n=1 Tax=Paenarthrobacter nicotinovorans TaxID=29320 RepID=UPI00382FFCC2
MHNNDSIFISDSHDARQILAEDLINETQDLLADLIDLRRAKGLTQDDIAKAIGVTRTAITAFERYDGDPKMSTIVRYAMAVGARISINVEDGQSWATQERNRAVWSNLSEPEAPEDEVAADLVRLVMASNR